jgi:hypothetical protein
VRASLSVRIGFVLGSAAFASACQEHFPTVPTDDAGAIIAPLELQAPAIVPPDSRTNASSSPVVFDPLRGGVWTANGDVGTISLVDVDARRVIAETGAIGQDIRSIALSPDATWIAAVDRGAATVTLIDANTLQPRRVIPLGTHPRACVWDAANPRWLYVTVEDDGAVVIVDRTLGEIAATIAVGRLPSGLAVSAERRELYVTHRIDGDLTIIDLHDRTVAAHVPLADEPFSDPSTPNGKPFGFESLAITPDGSHAWVPHELLASTHPLVFNQTLFPAISVVDLGGRVEQQTNPYDFSGAIAGRKNLFDAITLQDASGQPAILSQICAVTMHPNGEIAWAIACGSEDLLTLGVVEGRATRLLRNLGGDHCDHPAGLTLDDTGQRIFVMCDQSHTLVTLDTGDGSLLEQTTPYGAPISLVKQDPLGAQKRAGLTLFFRANSSKSMQPTTGNNWMSCGGCHLDGFGSNNLRLFEALTPRDPQTDAQIGHANLHDHFATAPDANFDPHDVLVALLEQGGLAPDRSGASRGGQVDPNNPSGDSAYSQAAQMATSLASVIATDLPKAPTWLQTAGTPPAAGYAASDTTVCGGCHPNEYAAWQESLHAHAAEDPMFLHGVDVERGLYVAPVGEEYTRLCAGCHDPVNARAGDLSLQAGRNGSADPQHHHGVTCLGCHDVDRVIRAGGNGDIESTAHDWATDHKAWALASLDKLRQPEFCGGCHQQFVPGTGLVAIGTLDEYHASQYAGTTRCIDCHMPKNGGGIADHHFPGGNIYVSTHFDDGTLQQEQIRELNDVLSLDAKSVVGGVLVTVHNHAIGHGFPTGVTDLREAWVELQPMSATGDGGPAALAHIGGPGADGVVAAGAARLGIDIAKPDGTVLYGHELSEATRIPFDVRVPAGEAQALFVPLPSALPPGTASLDAVLYFRNVRTTYFRAATASANDSAPAVELARVRVQP